MERLVQNENCDDNHKIQENSLDANNSKWKKNAESIFKCFSHFPFLPKE